MSIPHVERTVTGVDRTILSTSLDETFEALLDLPSVLADHDAIRLDTWPQEGLGRAGDTFWAVHSGLLPGHAVHYTVSEVDQPTGIAFDARSDLHEARHRVVLAPDGASGCEVVWTCTLEPRRPVSQGLLEDASLLGRTVLRRLTDADVGRAPAVGVGAATGSPVL